MAIEMNKKQKELFSKLTTLKQEIALNSLSGMNDIDSYKNSSGKAKTITAMESGACVILRNTEVTAFMDSMKQEAVDKALVTTTDVVKRMWEEGNDFSDGTSQSGRVSALKALTDYTGGFDNNKQKIEGKIQASDDSGLSW